MLVFAIFSHHGTYVLLFVLLLLAAAAEKGCATAEEKIMFVSESYT